MDVIRLRTMTLKSWFTGGIYVDIPMRILLDMGKRAYIVAKYYQYDSINFNEEMLKLLDITSELEIPKPGNNIDMYEEWKKANSLNHLTDLERMKMMSSKKSKITRNAKSKIRKMTGLSKGYLMNKNRNKY